MPGPFIIGEFGGVINDQGIVADDTPGSSNPSCDSIVLPPVDIPSDECDDVACGDTNLDGTTNVLVRALADINLNYNCSLVTWHLSNAQDVVETVSAILGSIEPLEGCAFTATDSNNDGTIEYVNSDFPP